MGLFSKMMDRCPKCGGIMEPDHETPRKIVQQRANISAEAGFNAIGELYSLNSGTYYKCRKCGYIEKRTVSSFGVVKQPYKG